ncbi:hypothetical protein [Streptomyces sp. c-19]|uniref:hypothetical protein n=1 Tax=Streptomyces sp. c-19 TaxID=2789275 RepID=UPI00397FBCBD
MSIIVKFFVAPDDTSASLALQSGPGPAFESLSFGNFDPEEAVLEWECLLAGGSFEELLEAGEPRIVAGQDNDGCVVFAISPRLSTALADAEHAGLRDVAASWIRLRAEDGGRPSARRSPTRSWEISLPSSAAPGARTRASTAGSRSSSCPKSDRDGRRGGGAEEDGPALVRLSLHRHRRSPHLRGPGAGQRAGHLGRYERCCAG